MPASPILRWPGGKRRLAPRIIEIARSATGDSGGGRTYIEPFVGGGAVLFEMADAGIFERAVVADLNPDLINLYRQVAEDPNRLVSIFDSWPQHEDVYYHIRDVAHVGMSDQERAARELYLNRLCFNGLYRKNRKGHFNVAWGKFKRHRPLDVENLRAVSNLLRRCDIVCDDFRVVIRKAGPGDIIYADPPYAIGEGRAFVEYTGRFEWSDHVDLVTELVAAVERGAVVIASNSCLDETVELYGKHGFNIERVEMARAINCDGNGRKKVPELLAWKAA